MKRQKIAFVALFLGCLIPSALLALDQKTAQERILYLQKLSKVDRDRLERNIQTFHALPSDQKNHFRQLHNEIETDHKQGGPMFPLLEAYSQWLNTLSPVQRDQLQKESDPGRKLALVRQFTDDQERQSKEEHDRLLKEEVESRKTNINTTNNNATNNTAGNVTPATKSMPDARQGYNWKLIQLTKNDLDAVIKVINDDLPPDNKTPDIQTLPIHQYWKVVAESAKVKQNFDEWPEGALLKKMTTKLRRPSAAFVMTSELRDETDRATMVRLILEAIVKQARDLVPDPSAEELAATYEKLSAVDQEKADKFENQERRRTFLRERFFQLNSDDTAKRFRECKKAVFELFQQLNVEPRVQFQPRPGPRREIMKKS